MDNPNDLTRGGILPKLLHFFFPVLLGMLFQQLYNTVDAVIVGNFVGPAALAAVGGSPAKIIDLVIGFFTGLSSGATVIISQYYGSHDEDQLAEAKANQGKGNSAAADSLQAVIDQIKADQLNFYAMPFSVQYGVNEWNVSDEEMDKVKAVARVMKDNDDVKIMVVGFADYTGSDQYNMKLSEKRANEVKRLLVKKYGIAEDRIETDYKGKSVAFGDIQYALNRRVSFYRVIE
jgi:outer membrane protein OmpA-like peptidoglycan-associated protein